MTTPLPPAGASPYPMDQRVRQPVLTRPHIPPAQRETLERIAAALRAIPPAADPAADARRYASVYDLAAAAHGSGPHPVIPAAQPSPPPAADGAAGGAWLAAFMRGLLTDAAEGAAQRIYDGGCPDCRGRLTGWCDQCEEALARAARYARLAALVDLSDSDRGAVAALLAEEWRHASRTDGAAA